MQTDTQTPTLETPLRRWAELEPAWAKLAQDTIPPDEAYHIGAWAHAGYYVQIAVQQAIEAQGMWWSFENEQFFVSYAATVHKRGGSKKTWQAFSEYTPAAALLSAYLQALEAQQ